MVDHMYINLSTSNPYCNKLRYLLTKKQTKQHYNYKSTQQRFLSLNFLSKQFKDIVNRVEIVIR